ncbi:DUF7827 domain-containing protein, partial [Halosimplex sp. J119]
MTSTEQKLRSLFLTMLMVTSVFAGSVAFAGTAAAANEEPDLTEVYQEGSDLVVVFDDDVEQHSEASDLSADNFTIWRRDSTGNYFYSVNGSQFSVTPEKGGSRYRLSGWPTTGGPATTIRVSVDGARPASTSVGSGDYTASFENVTADMPSKSYSVLESAHSSRKDAARIYQGEVLSFTGQTDNQKLDVINVETGEIVLDGSTGVNSDNLRVDTGDLNSGSTYKVAFEKAAGDSGPIQASPGDPGANTFTFDIDLSEYDSSDTVSQFWVEFGSSGNPSGIDPSAISDSQISIDGDDTDPANWGVYYASSSGMLVGTDGFQLDQESGTVTVTVSDVDAPNTGSHTGTLELQNSEGATLASNSDTWEITDSVYPKKFFNVTNLGLEASIDADGETFTYKDELPLSEPGQVNFTYDVEGSAIRGDSQVVVRTNGPDDAGSWEDTANGTMLDNRGQFDETIRFLAPPGARGYGSYNVEVIDVQTGVTVEAGEFTVDSLPAADSASFGGGVFEEERGDVVEIPVNLDDSEEGAQATVSIGTLSETNYVTNVTVADVNGDGEVVVEWNTYMSGTGERDHIFSAEGDDNVTAWGGESGSFVDAVR